MDRGNLYRIIFVLLSVEVFLETKSNFFPIPEGKPSSILNVYLFSFHFTEDCDLFPNFRCHSSIGRDGGEQSITLGPDCYYLGVIMHEMTHAVGFFHEQNRWDRDDYITIHWNNIQPGMI